MTGHLWDENKKFGYRFYETSEALTDAYLSLLEKELKPLILLGLTAAVYTQTTDVEIEINGYLTYDRKVEKMAAEKLKQAHAGLYNNSMEYGLNKCEREDVRCSLTIQHCLSRNPSNRFPKIIDTFYEPSRIAPNMFTAFATPRTRRPRPTSQRRSGAFRLDDMNANVR